MQLTYTQEKKFTKQQVHEYYFCILYPLFYRKCLCWIFP